MGRLDKAMADMPQRRRDSTAPGLRRTASVVRRSSVIGGAQRSSALALEPADTGQIGSAAGTPPAQSARSSVTSIVSPMCTGLTELLI